MRKQKVKAFLGIFNRRLDEIVPQFLDANTAINSPAATQQLLARVVDDNGTLSYNTFLDGAYRTMVNFDGTGFTQPYRFVATSNGSQCGIPLAAPYSQLASLDADGSGNIFGLTLWTKGRAYLDMRRLPDIGQTSSILNFTLKLKVKILIYNLLKISMQIQKNAPGNLLPLDGLAGGTRNLGGGVVSANLSTLPAASGGSNWLLFGYSFNYSTPYIAPTFTFVPTTSSLDVANFNAVNIPYIVPMTGLNGSRAANYIAQERITLAPPIGVTDNVTHTDFYARTCNWLYNEMENFPQPTNCNDVCPNNIMINGPAEICNTGAYSVPGLPSYATLTWSSSDNNIATVDNTGTVNKVANGYITLTAAINFNGGLSCNIPSTLTKAIKVGIELSNITVSYSRNNSLIQYIDFGSSNNASIYTQTGNFRVNAFSGLPGVNNYTWLVMGGSTYSNFNTTGASATFNLLGANAPTIALSVTLTNTLNGCSSSTTKYVVFVGSIPGGRIASFDVSPNPANTTINITASSNKNESKANEEKVSLPSIREIKLIDKMGNVKLTKRYADDLTKSDRINIAHLPNDIYTLMIFNGTDWEAHKIVKQ